jgi:hypothetical protein
MTDLAGALPDPSEALSVQRSVTEVTQDEALMLRELESKHDQGDAAKKRFETLMGQVDEEKEKITPSEGDEGEPEGEKTDPDEKSEEDEKKETEPDPEQQEALEKALKAIRRDKVPTSVIDKMTTEEILEYGKAVAKIRSDHDTHVQKLTEELKSAKETIETEAKSSEPAEPADHPADVSKMVTSLVEDHGFSEEAAGAVVALTQKLAEQSFAPKVATLESQLAETQEKLQSALGMGGQALVEGERHRLRERVPELSDDTVWSERVKPALERLDASAYEGVNEMLLDAVRIAGLKVYTSADKARSARERADSAKDNGQPSSRSRAAQQTKSPDEREDDVLRALEAKHGLPG